ncbi:MAG: fumarylacetoacetate hydrolase family protein [Rhodospirillales bacterium]|nr:fumarylacetoacetate hydrolase family protein [Rhodospirillales bacterium]
MRLISYELNGAEGVGVMVDDSGFVPAASVASDLPATMLELLERDGAIDALKAAADGKPAEMTLADVKLLPVVPNPKAIWCVGVNYKDHQDETGRGAQEEPMIFLRIAEAQIAHGDPMVRPSFSDTLDWEGELAVIIGKRGRAIPMEKAFDHIAGYSIYNDGSVREWQRHTSQFAPGKNFQDTGGFGPWMVTPDEFGDPYAHELTTRINGEQVQHTAIAAMDHKIDKLINYLSTAVTLNPGDVIATGTPGGVGSRRDPPWYMKPGDVCTVEITGIGVLENPVIDG